MIGSARQPKGRGLNALRRFVDSRPADVERCELCAAPLAERHQHLADPDGSRLLCTCDACAMLFNDTGQTRYRRVPRDGYLLEGFDIDSQLWNSLGIPTGLAFFSYSSKAARVLAFYPSPAGPTEADIDLELWEEVVSGWPRLRGLAPDVEALLVNRMNGANQYFLAPIDECYILTGLIKKHWTGFSGGEVAWAALKDFFDGLKQRSRSLPVSVHAGA